MADLLPPTGPRHDDPQSDRQGWVERPWAARAVGTLAYLVPFVASIAVAFGLSSVLPVVSTLVLGLVRWLAIAVVSTVVLVLVERQTRRLLPLRTLLGLTLAFPDRAPSRFKIAIRTGTTNQLRARLAEARDGKLGDTPSDAAERLLELVGMLSQHDRLTRGHSERVRAYSHLIGEEMGLSGVELDRLRWAGLLHDVGKLAISTDILNKPGKLTRDEFDLIKTHPMEGKKLVEPLAEWLGEAARAVWEHHERFDGGGYPQGLAGTSISRAARIVSVADVFDVMTSVRSYKAATGPTAARKELADCAGTQFDPDVVKAFLAVSLSRVRGVMGPLSWLAQLALVPGAIVAQAGPTLATAAAVTAGAASGAVGVAIGQSGAAVADQPSANVAIEQVVDVPDPPDTVVTISRADAMGVRVTSGLPGRAKNPPNTTPRDDIPTTTARGPIPNAPGTTTTTAPPSTVGTTVPPTATTAAPSTSIVTTTTAAPATTAAPTTTTTVAAIDLFAGDVFLMPSDAGDTTSSAVLPMGTDAPIATTLFNYDTDRDSGPGLLIAKDTAGPGGTDPSKVQVFRLTSTSTARIADGVRVELYVAGKDFNSADIRVAIRVDKCSASGVCTTLGSMDREVQNANKFKKLNLNLDEIDVVVQAGERLELRVAALADSEDDMWLAFGTADLSSQLHID